MSIENINAVEIKNLSLTYKVGNVEALKNVSFSIKKGEIFGLLGPNGAGKSTLISVLAGIQKPTEGKVKVWDYSIEDDITEIKKITGLVPQEISFDGFFNTLEMLKLHSGYFGILKNDKYIEELLKAFDLWEKRLTNTRRLSGGMQRRLLVAKALVHKPPFLILDEPTAGVDVKLRNNLWEYVKRLNEQGTTILLTTHYLFEAENLCDRIAIINNGELKELDTLENLKSKFKSADLEKVFLKLTDENI